jgi:hypothetical protein
MRAAIDAMFPGTIHRNCRWHIVDKAIEEDFLMLPIRAMINRANTND